MRSRSGRLALLLGGFLLVPALTTCAVGPQVEITATDPPRTASAPAEAPATATDPPRRLPPTRALADADAPERLPAADEAPDSIDGPDPAQQADALPETPAPARVAAAAAPEPSEPPAATTAQPTRVVIPRINVANPLVPVGLHPDRTLVVPDRAPVAGWYTGAPRPGETGPAVLVGHNSWKGSRGVFWDLHRLVAGDVIEVHHDDGSVVRFAVERVEQYPKAAFPTQRVYGNTPRQEIRVITCGGAFDTRRRSHVDNIVVFGVQIP